ncbi:MAG: polymerase subunit gamma and tau [Gemmatimonadetes bacterium]|nr:polymerase subunit gamma and tau [Gemmatimonadota bacterium]
MSLALARKYRPRTFADVAVQSHVATTLKGAIARDRVAHGYLLCGPRGTGKTTLARVLAMALNCENRQPDGEPCGACTSCTRIWAGSASLDVIEIDAASNRGVDDARDLRERAMYAPSGDDRYKVYIVDEAHMLTREAWNSLLKVLEEPPPRVVFVFATTEPYKIAQTAAPVLSRLQRFDLKRIGPADIRARLVTVLASEKITAEPEAIAMIARAADGSMRDALSLTDQVLAMGDGRVTADHVREALGLVAEDELLGVLDMIAERRAQDVFPMVARLADGGVDLGQFLAGLADMLRAQLATTLGGSPPDLSDRAREALTSRKDRIPAGDLLRMLNALAELEIRFRKSGQQQLLLEAMLVRFALMDRTVELEAVLRALGPGGGPVGGPVGGSPPAVAPIAPPRGGSRPNPGLAEGHRETETGAPPAPTRPQAAPIPQRAVAGPSAAVRAAHVPELSAVAGRWEDLVESIQRTGKGMLTTVLQHASPVSINAAGVLAVELSAENDLYAQAFESGKGDVVAALREWFPGVERVVVRRTDGGAPVPQKRLTDDEIRVQRLDTLRKKDAVLAAAIDALDLEVVD